MQPKIILEIKNHIPSIIYSPEENVSRELITEKENIHEILLSVLEALNLKLENSTDLVDILELALEGDEKKFEKLPDLDKYAKGFGLSKFVEIEIGSYDTPEISEYEKVASKEVLEELQKFHNIDLLASILESIYNIMISKSVFYAQDLGIGTIILDDHDGYLRLQSKFANELAKLEIEQEIITH